MIELLAIFHPADQETKSQVSSLLSETVVVVSVTQSCPTLCDPMDCSLPGSSVHGILQARIIEWVAASSSRESSQPRDQTWVSCIATRSSIFAWRIPWTEEPGGLQSMGVTKELDTTERLNHSNKTYGTCHSAHPSQCAHFDL